jgi:protein-arginine kinase activator protein McsA
MLCQLCRANPATIHSVEFINKKEGKFRLCHECWSRTKAMMPFWSLYGPIAMYAQQMEVQEKLTKKTFQQVLVSRILKPEQYAKRLCAISLRYLFHQIKDQYPKRCSVSILDIIQKCNERLVEHAKSYSGDSLQQWQKLLKSIVRNTIRKARNEGS